MQVSDDLYLGTAFVSGSNGSAGPSNMTTGVGPLGRFYCFDVVPAASGTTTTQNQLATTQQLTAATALTLTAGTGVTLSDNGQGTAIYVLDCERTVAIYSAADCSSSTLTVRGYDRYGQLMSQAITGPNNSTVQTTKCFKSIVSITSSATVAQNVVAGLGTGIGLPFRCTDLGYVASVMYNQTAIAITSTLCKVADVTSPATTTTTDVRGYIIVGQTDAAKRLVVNYALPALASGPSATRVGAVGVTQNLA
jgi:hypothetical protein